MLLGGLVVALALAGAALGLAIAVLVDDDGPRIAPAAIAGPAGPGSGPGPGFRHGHGGMWDRGGSGPGGPMMQPFGDFRSCLREHGSRMGQHPDLGRMRGAMKACRGELPGLRGGFGR